MQKKLCSIMLAGGLRPVAQQMLPGGAAQQIDGTGSLGKYVEGAATMLTEKRLQMRVTKNGPSHAERNGVEVTNISAIS